MKGQRSKPGGEIGHRPAHLEVDDNSNSLRFGQALLGYRTYSSRELQRRSSRTVFVENVSKRIYVLTLKEAFQCYGHVVDVYIAYRNRKRQGRPTTFAFVRFRSLAKAKWAVKNGDNQKMDGFCIKVFLAKEEGEGAVEKKPVQKIRTKNK
ncbi:hypothetical protein V6N11_022289 [Hibiscus sabdariffa]|uniref:RRM domain-containing protein n=1 Tax=Hibiscus sabdariffa TaxID=183260 RepID=A0ABR2TIS5_9ROSI